MWKSNILAKLGREKECFEACERAVEINPNCTRAWNNYALALRGLGRVTVFLFPPKASGGRRGVKECCMTLE
ncbi:tetratricopeptide repeat protein, partial [Microcoleus sp. herbarium13]|uniref:tetratricopeptide repeat protein n=2 Tax=unclassified Microcoleus TaxID=2642155 RepID=UPI003B1DAE8A